MVKDVRKAIQTREIKIRNGKEIKWYDKECRDKRRIIRDKLRSARQGHGSWEDYRKIRRDYSKLCRDKKRKQRDREEEEIKNIRNENEAWAYINKERKKRIGVHKGITKEQWDNHFRKKLQGNQERPKWVEVGSRLTEGIERKEITTEEIERHIEKLKKKKAPGEDGIANEAWMYAGEKTINRIT